MSNNKSFYCGHKKAVELLNAHEAEIDIAFALNVHGNLPRGWKVMEDDDHDLIDTYSITDSDIEKLLAITNNK